MRACNDIFEKTLRLTETMIEIADLGDAARDDVGFGILYGLLRDSAFKIRKMAEEEMDAHIRKGWWARKKRPGEKETNRARVVQGQTTTNK